jgi:hypothetical protein
MRNATAAKQFYATRKNDSLPACYTCPKKSTENYLFVCGSFNDAFNTELSVVTNVVIINESLIGKDMDRTDSCPAE